ncbi:MAG: hypothetical protein RL497_685 [Pseudomonadota bacterium]
MNDVRSAIHRHPADWQECYLSDLISPDSSITYGVVQPGPEIQDGVLFIRGGDIFNGKIFIEKLRTISKEISSSYKRTLLNGGELVMSLVGYPGEVAIVPSSLKGANIARQAALIRLKNEVCNTFVMYYLLSESGKYFLFEKSTGSAQQVINLADLKYVKVILPPMSQQQKIAKILTAVDNLIEQTQALIDKYTAIKQGMMADLFTRGIDLSGTPETNPNHGQLRPSFEEAPELYKETELGWVPREWRTVSLGEIAEKITSGSRDWAAYYADSGDLFVRISNLTREHINFRWDSVKYVDIGGGSEGERTRLLDGDILISITADLGIVGVVPKGFERAYINQHTALVRLVSQCNPRFTGNYLSSHSGQVQFEKYNDTGAKAGLNLPTIASLKCLFPSLNEQAEISKIIDALDSKVSIQKVELSKHEMVKKGLMQDLLTGKVQVTA